jgi:phage terminase small subunit
MTPKQEAFVREYLVDLNATQAAIRAGYSAKTARQTAAEYLAKPDIAAAVQKAMDERAERTEITADYVLKTIHETIERCKQAVPVYDRKGASVLVETPAGDLVPAYVFDSTAVLKGAELLGKHLKLFTDKVEVSGDMKINVLSEDAAL